MPKLLHCIENITPYCIEFDTVFEYAFLKSGLRAYLVGSVAMAPHLSNRNQNSNYVQKFTQNQF